VDKKHDQLLIWGVYPKDEGYPNVVYRIEELANHFELREVNCPIWNYTAVHRRKINRVLISHVIVSWQYLWTRYSGRLIYIPYPAVFLLFFLSLLPKFLSYKWIVADVFISLYDTIVNDRKLLSPRSISARILHWIEARAYRIASVIVTDTLPNAEFLRHEFNLTANQIVAIPLSTNEKLFFPREYFAQSKVCRVLFIGTFIPLHGVEYLAETIIILRERTNIQFTVIGDGQETQLFSRILSNYAPQLKWIREWQPAQRLAEEITQADICLGIFGNSAKAQRVCPLKIYAYAAVGRAIITGDTQWLRTEGGSDFFSVVPTANSLALADQIVALANQPRTREQLAIRSRQFYETKLSNSIARNALLRCFPQRK